MGIQPQAGPVTEECTESREGPALKVGVLGSVFLHVCGHRAHGEGLEWREVAR